MARLDGDAGADDEQDGDGAGDALSGLGAGGSAA
jgi:hypothetical protein